jgi:hypothetical protein
MTTALKTYPHFELQQITEIKIKTKKQANKLNKKNKQIKQTKTYSKCISKIRATCKASLLAPSLI